MSQNGEIACTMFSTLNPPPTPNFTHVLYGHRFSGDLSHISCVAIVKFRSKCLQTNFFVNLYFRIRPTPFEYIIRDSLSILNFLQN